MSRFRQWLTSTALAVLPACAWAEAPLPGGTVVGGVPNSTKSIVERPVYTATTTAPPDALAPTPTASPMPVAQIPGAMTAPVPMGTPWTATDPNCCGPLGAHGPIGQDVYFRFGPAIPIGDSTLAKALNVGWTLQTGGRAEFFEPGGAAAWALDAHLTYTYNNAGGQDLAFVRNDLVTIRALHRWAVGLAGGRDWFVSGPGFVGGSWDANARYGIDFGGRWGTGHVDAQPITDASGYRRKQDTFGQLFSAAHGDVEVPVGAWTFLAGGRVEFNYTSSKYLVAGNTLYDLTFLFTVGVRY